MAGSNLCKVEFTDATLSLTGFRGEHAIANQRDRELAELEDHAEAEKRGSDAPTRACRRPSNANGPQPANYACFSAKRSTLHGPAPAKTK